MAFKKLSFGARAAFARRRLAPASGGSHCHESSKGEILGAFGGHLLAVHGSGLLPGVQIHGI